MTHALTLPQALFLLGRDDATGKPLGYHNRYIQPAGALTQLVMMGRLSLQPGRYGVVDVLSTAPTGSHYLDTILARVAASSRPRHMQHWISCLSGMRGRVRMIGEELAAKGIVEEIPDKILGLFPVTRWVQRRAGPKLSLTSDMMKILFNESAEPNERMGSIIALANAGHLLKRNFDRARLRENKAHIKRLVKGKWPGAEAANKTIQAVQASIAATTVIIASAGIT